MARKWMKLCKLLSQIERTGMFSIGLFDVHKDRNMRCRWPLIIIIIIQNTQTARIVVLKPFCLMRARTKLYSKHKLLFTHFLHHHFPSNRTLCPIGILMNTQEILPGRASSTRILLSHTKAVGIPPLLGARTFPVEIDN